MKHLSLALAVIAVGACKPVDESDALGVDEMSMEEAGEASAPKVVRDGPFGFAMGQPISEVPEAKESEPGFYTVTSPPKPHPDFEMIALEAYPDTGICTIRGIGRDLQSDGGGASIRTKVDSLSEALKTKYGMPRKNDRCYGNDISCRNEFWMMTLSSNERIYGYFWEKPNEAMKAANIGEIAVGAMASNIADTYPVLEFYSEDVEACETARNAVSAEAL